MSSAINGINKYSASCRRISITLLLFSIFLLLILQFMCFFVAINAGYDEYRALILSLVPVVGPVYCAVELGRSGAGEPVILLVLFLSFLTNFGGFLYFRRKFKKSLYSEATDLNDNFVNPVSLEQDNVPEGLAEFDINSVIGEEIIEFEPVITRSETVKNHIEDEIYEKAEDSVSGKYDIDNVLNEILSSKRRDDKHEGGKEYDELLNDVLSILNKK